MSNLEIIWDGLCICSVMAKVEGSLDPELWVGLTNQHMEIAK